MKAQNLLLSFVFLFSLNLMAQEKSPLNWQIGYHKTASEVPAKWYKSTVPGAVQLDVMNGDKTYKQPYWYADNYKQFLWMEPYYFTYKTSFAKPMLKQSQKVFFHSKGIDYEFVIYLNGEKIWAQEGMFTYVDLDITDKLKDQNELKIMLMPIPKVPCARDTQWLNRENAAHSAKPAVSYGWDWHPRLVTRGIWDETYLDVRNASFLKAADVDYILSAKLNSAKVNLNVEVANPDANSYRWTFRDEVGSQLITKEGTVTGNNFIVSDSLKNIQLWWPNGYGNPTLYISSFELYDRNKMLIEKRDAKVGFRTIKIIMSEGGWIEPQAFPKSRSVAAANFEVNGKRIFAKGSNWVHPEIFPGIITRAIYEAHIKLAKEANFNILRVWGGGITNKESFFELCDRYGILVWQEFPLACNLYPDEPKYLSVLEQEAKSIIKRVKPHASLALWCGGNELFNEWSKMTEQSLPLRLLNKLCLEMDPKTPFIYTSPLFGMAHGHYIFYENIDGSEVFQWMSKAKNTTYTEFGISGIANIDVIKSMMPATEWFPPKEGSSWESHHAFINWGERRWQALPFLEEYFGKIKNLEDLVAYSQLTQCEGYKCIFEEARRQKPYCGMAINWSYQEPWPCAANSSLINWPSKPKPAYYHVAKACRPVLASARIPKFRWDEGEAFSCDLFMLNDTYEKLNASLVTAKIVYDDHKELTFLRWDFPGSEEAKNYAGPTGRVPLPKMKNNLFKLVVEVAGKPEYKSEYTFVYRGLDVLNAKPKIQYLNGVTE